MSETLPKPPSDFEKAAADSQSENLVSEFWAFLAQNKKWWLLPIVIVMLLLGTLIRFPALRLHLLSIPCSESVCRYALSSTRWTFIAARSIPLVSRCLVETSF